MRVRLAVVCLLLAHTAHAQGAAQDARQAIPVAASTVVRRDVPVMADGIGTVQALQSVMIRAQVSGMLDKVLFTEGQQVRKGEVLAVIDPRPYRAALDQALAKRAADQASLAAAQADLKRYSALVQRDFASRQQLDQQHATVGQLTANLRGDAATIATAALNLSFTQITAPFAGHVGLRQIDPGTLIQANASTIVTLAETRPIAVIYTLPQDEVPAVRAAQSRGAVPVSAYAGDGKTLLGRGTLLAIDVTIEQATGTIRLKAVFPNADERLWPGEFVNVRTQLGTLRNAVTIPDAAVQHGPDGLYVYEIGRSNKASLRPIEVTQDQDGMAVVSKGLQGGETIVTEGQSRLADGMRVTVSNAGHSG